MKINFKKFERNYYNDICNFLVEISKNNHRHINWNWARWEWMFFHPEFNRDLIDKIGLWFLDEKLNGLGIAVNDMDSKTLKLLKDNNFLRNDQTENILELKLDEVNFNLEPINGITLENIDIEKDLYKHHELLWKGFNHEGQAPLDEYTINKQKLMLSAPHLNPLLHVVAKNKCNEYVAYCGLWFNDKTDYVYVEPVCTIPEYRNKGIARMVLMESLKRAYSLGAKKAYVISDSDFYKSLGFKQLSHYTFYWYNR